MKNARQLSFEVLNKIYRDSSYSNLTLDRFFRENDLDEREKSLMSRLVYGVLERQITLDYQLEKALSKPLKKLKPQVLCALRLGVYQLFFTDKIPSSAAINESVKLVKNNGCAFASGLVNAVLRSVSDRGLVLPPDDSADHLSVEYSFPQWLIDLWIESYGENNTISILEECCKVPPVSVRVNTLKISQADFEALPDIRDLQFSKGMIDNSFSFSSLSFENLPSFEKGLFHVQDVSSQLCAAVLSPKPGDTVIDLCSAPGGKAFTMAEIMENRGRIVSCDIHSHRLALIMEGARRLGVDIIEPMLNDGSLFSDKLPLADCVLCDVPCSGLGIIRRKPEIKFKSPVELSDLPEIQYKILSNASKYVKPGGRLVYSTCTLNSAENTDITERFIADNSEFVPLDIDMHGISCIEKNKTVTLLPGVSGTDGFFIALFERRV